MLGVHVAHFCPMCLTARNGLRHPKSPVMSRTSPTRFDAWSSRCGRPEWTLGGHPHVLGRRVVRCGRAGAPWGPNPKTDDAFRAVITSLWLVLVL